jgi:tRNA threonylcarbamoyl adenosine modification protein (Sua5/YciO/YrdC/YwlC family)
MQNQKIYWGFPQAKSALAAAFDQNKAVLAESDTVWGLLIPAVPAGAKELDRLKKRRDKPYLVLMGSLEAVEQVAYFPPNGSYELAKKAWPGPLTLLLPINSEARRSQRRRRGVRVPDHEPLRQAAAQYGGLFSTSANISGEPVPTKFEDVPASIRAEVGAIIYNNPGYTPHSQPSTIVDCSGETLKIIRHGAYPLSDQ